MQTAVYLKADENRKVQRAAVTQYLSSHPELGEAVFYLEEQGEEDGSLPEFDRLIGGVRSGEIRVVLTYRFSEFGRDELEAGYYAATIFPMLHVRFLAVLDGIDTAQADSRDRLETLLFSRALEVKSKEFSRKQTEFRRLCRETGRVMGNYAAYGYRFSKEKEQLVIDPGTEGYVRMLFAWALSGIPGAEIAKRLTLVGAVSPAEAKGTAQSGWSESSVKQIVYNPVYAGFHVMGKRRQSLSEELAPMNVGRDQWIFFPDAHEPYITMEEYEKLQELQKKRIRAKEAKKPELFTGKVFCAECGRAMQPVSGYFRCRNAKADGGCTNRHVPVGLLKLAAADQLRSFCTWNDEAEFEACAEAHVEAVRVSGNGACVKVDL